MLRRSWMRRIGGAKPSAAQPPYTSVGVLSLMEPIVPAGQGGSGDWRNAAGARAKRGAMRAAPGHGQLHFG